MTNDIPTNPLANGVLPQSGVGQAGSTAPNGAARTGESADVPFRLLLERLQSRAQELEQAAPNVDDAERLSGAVETARASLEDAVSLGDRLLEAYREARQHSEFNGNHTTDKQENRS